MNISQKKLEKSRGRLEIKIKNQNLQKLYQQGSSKALMPDFHENLKQLMLINTAGGITSGDEYDYKFEIDSSKLCISTQAAEKIYSGFGEERYFKITKRIYGELDARLKESKFLAGNDYTIADIATWPWIARHEWHDIGLKKYQNLSRWYLEIAKREAVIKGYSFMDKQARIPGI